MDVSSPCFDCLRRTREYWRTPEFVTPHNLWLLYFSFDHSRDTVAQSVKTEFRSGTCWNTTLSSTSFREPALTKCSCGRSYAPIEMEYCRVIEALTIMDFLLLVTSLTKKKSENSGERDTIITLHRSILLRNPFRPGECRDIRTVSSMYNTHQRFIPERTRC